MVWIAERKYYRIASHYYNRVYSILLIIRNRRKNMPTLKCPHCGQVFSVDETEISSLVKQIRDQEFEKELNSRVDE